jgi:hypothetical protein
MMTRETVKDVLIRQRTKLAALFLVGATGIAWAAMVQPARADCTTGCAPGNCAMTNPYGGYSCYGIGAEYCSGGQRLRCSDTANGACWVWQGPGC